MYLIDILTYLSDATQVRVRSFVVLLYTIHARPSQHVPHRYPHLPIRRNTGKDEIFYCHIILYSAKILMLQRKYDRDLE